MNISEAALQEALARVEYILRDLVTRKDVSQASWCQLRLQMPVAVLRKRWTPLQNRCSQQSALPSMPLMPLTAVA